MKSFRTEIENPIVEQDIIELERKIALFKNGKVDEKRFRSLRLARGVYGQRQPGVQMIRIKIPFGQLNARKLKRICEVSEKYSTGRLHITTRQDIQIHYVSLDKTPELWAELEQDEITLREACGNTVRNITASATAGIDPNEPFDPRPYADALFRYFLRNPICQEMGRKFKISFSNSKSDTALAFMHDVGFIAKTKEESGKTRKGFEVWVGGGLGSQSKHAYLYSDFIPTDQIIPLTEAILRVFERYGERNRRMKARLKFLIKDMGETAFNQLVAEELQVLPSHHLIPYNDVIAKQPENLPIIDTQIKDSDAFRLWKKVNVFVQKNGLFAIGLKIRLGDIFTEQARQLADWIKAWAGDELTLTIDQNIIVRHVPEWALPIWFKNLNQVGLADIGVHKFNDITACPGTDTCNLSIASSTGLALVLEQVLADEYPDLAYNAGLNIKLSGCMNSCGQHMIASIGFQGMSMKTKDKRMLPAAQVLIGGASLGEGKGRFADKIIKVPSKKAPQALRVILDDYKRHSKYPDQPFLDYYLEKGEKYFYGLLKPLASLDELNPDDFLDWGHTAPYIKAIGVGECAGVVIDLIATLFFETEEKLERAARSLEEGKYQDSIYHTYAAIVNTAKALLLTEDKKTNTHIGIINQFQETFIDSGKIQLDTNFDAFTLQMKTTAASVALAEDYLNKATHFYKLSDQYRKKELENAGI